MSARERVRPAVFLLLLNTLSSLLWCSYLMLYSTLSLSSSLRQTDHTKHPPVTKKLKDISLQMKVVLSEHPFTISLIFKL